MNLVKMIGVSFAIMLGSQFAVAAEGSSGESRLRAYVTNFEGEKISVIDLKDQKEIAQIKTSYEGHSYIYLA